MLKKTLPNAIKPLAITHYTATCALGSGRQTLAAALRQGLSGLQPCTVKGVSFPTSCGAVNDDTLSALPRHWQKQFDCRNNRLAWHGLQADGFAEQIRVARQRYGAARVGVVLGTSTAGMRQTEYAYRERARQQQQTLPPWFRYAGSHAPFSLADFVRQAFALNGPAQVISTACSSSAKTFACAARWLQSGVVDAVLTGGVDTLCLTTLYGFRALGLASETPCRPFDAERSGLSLGEAAAFALLERAADAPQAPVWLRGYGESGDAWHMSSPHPQGEGARQAMMQCLARGNCDASEVDYINLHGTATVTNDSAESLAIKRVFTTALPPVSSTKGLTGHTLGAAGALEAVICAESLLSGWLPGNVGLQKPDPALLTPLTQSVQKSAIGQVLSNSFGFGGSNCSLLFSRAEEGRTP